MIDKEEYYKKLYEGKEADWRRKVTFESFTYKEILNNPDIICCIDTLLKKSNCVQQENCRECSLKFIKEHKKDFKKDKKGNAIW